MITIIGILLLVLGFIGLRYDNEIVMLCGGFSFLSGLVAVIYGIVIYGILPIVEQLR